MQRQNLQLGLQVDFVIVLGGQPVFGRVAVLGHHDDRGLQGRQHGQNEVEKNVRIGIERFTQPRQNDRVQRYPGKQQRQENDDERPGPAKDRDAVGEALPYGQGLLEFLMGVAADVQAFRHAVNDALLAGTNRATGLPKLGRQFFNRVVHG